MPRPPKPTAPTWFFAPLSGGEESGLNESGIEAFKRSESLGRETCQNILDHADGLGKPCIAVFEYIDLPQADFPGHDVFVNIFSACQEHVLKTDPHGAGNERRFFEKGLNLLQGRTIPTLRIGDENTTGLGGDDDDRAGPFWRLLKGQGFSSLQGVGGGTYGIGQRAPFARSALRTVLYSTRLASGTEAFVAKAILASHPNPLHPARRMTQSKGWYCHAPEKKGQPWRAIRDPAIIPKRYRRSVVGTDLYVTGYIEQDWEQRSRHAVLQNFFSAIDRGFLEVHLKKNGELLGQINRQNLEEELVRAADEARRTLPKPEYLQGLGSTLYYLKALRNPLNGAPYTRKIDNLGTVKLYVHRDLKNNEIPQRWACMRRPMMVVDEHGSGLLSRFAAVLVSDDDPGNQLLAHMEDPRHSRWHEEEARNWTPEERKRGRDARLDVHRFVAETLKKIRDESMPPSQDVPFLGRYLPLESDPEEESALGTSERPTGGSTDDETGHRTTKPASAPVTGRARKSQKTSIAIDIHGPTGRGDEDGGEAPADIGDDDQDDDVGGDDGDSPGAEDSGDESGGGGDGGGDSGDGGGDDRGATGGKDLQTGGSEPGRDPGTGPVARLLTSSEVRFRSYMAGKRYCVILESKLDVTGDIELRAVGEDSTYPLQLISARDPRGGPPLGVSGARITGVKLVAGQPRRIDIEVDAGISLCLSLGR